jgi:hypothetical protein
MKMYLFFYLLIKIKKLNYNLIIQKTYHLHHILNVNVRVNKISLNICYCFLMYSYVLLV